jgi:hypothetical protein
MNEYQKQAKDFCNKYGVKITAKFDHYGKHFADDKEGRDIYAITIEREGKRPWTFNFGQSIAESQKPQRVKALKDRAMNLGLINYDFQIRKGHISEYVRKNAAILAHKLGLDFDTWMN